MAATFNEEKFAKCNHIILDIEGTTTSITFVKDILFPYACEKVGKFLEAQWEVEGVQEAVEGMRLQADKDILNKVEGAVPIPDTDASKEDQIKGVVDNFMWLTSIDSKGTFMKKLSGLIWEKGYMSGDIKGHVYNDVPPALESWQELGKHVYIYSSGSVHAQKLLMKHSELGDLSARFTANFDTVVGPKQEVESYKNIVKNIKCQPEEALFLTDIVKEAEAAHAAGLNVCLVVREGNAPLTEEDVSKFRIIKSFHEVKLQPPSSKRKQDEEQEESRPTKVAKIDEDSAKTDDNDTKQEVVESMDTADAKQTEDTKSVETEEPKPETEIEQEKKTEGNNTLTVPEIMETEVVQEKSADVDVVKAVEEVTPTVTDDKMEEDVQAESNPDNDKVEVSVEKESNVIVEDKPKEGTENETTLEEDVEISEGETAKKDVDGSGDVTEDKVDDTPVSEAVVPEVETAKQVEETISEDITTTPTLIDEESKSSLDNINVDIAVDADEEEKITDLLGAGEALDKECDDILSKVDQVTSKDLAVKPFIEKEISSKDSILDDALEVISEEPTCADSHKVTEEIANSPVTDSNKKVEETETNGSDSAVTETSDNSHDKHEAVVEPANDKITSQETPATENSNSEATKTNGDSKECLENGSKTEVNGKESENGVEQNGSNGDTKQETNGANGDSKKEVVAESESVDIKSKKLPTTEEVTAENVPIQAET